MQESLDSAANRADLARQNRLLDRHQDETGVGALPPGEIIVIRHILGMSQAQLARALGVAVLSVKRWELGERWISSANEAALQRLLEHQNTVVDAAIKTLRRAPYEDRNFIIYRDDNHLRAHHPDTTESAGSIRAIAARVYVEADFTVDIVIAPEA